MNTTRTRTPKEVRLMSLVIQLTAIRHSIDAMLKSLAAQEQAKPAMQAEPIDYETWFAGPPPSIGWWPASVGGTRTDIVRWFDGCRWSRLAVQTDRVTEAAFFASIPEDTDLQSRIKWRNRPANWPARSLT